MPESFRIGVALGGGGARGIAHLGVLSVLEKAQIPIHLIAGVSFGALVGAMYAIEPDVQLVQKRIVDFLHSPVFKKVRFEFMKRDYQESKNIGLLSKLRDSVRRGIFYGVSFRRQAYISEGEFQRMISHVVDHVDVEKTQIPIFMSAADLISGQEYVIEKGSLHKALSATCALPGIFPPIHYENHLLIDGGWINPVPVELARRRGADFIIAVNTCESLLIPKNLQNGLDLLLRADAMARGQLAELVCRGADVVIRPDIGGVHWADFSRPADYMALGIQAAETKIGEIQRLLWKKKIRKSILG